MRVCLPEGLSVSPAGQRIVSDASSCINCTGLKCSVFIAPRFATDGGLASPARLTVFHNGVLVQNDVVLKGNTPYRGYPRYTPHAARLPLSLQDHGDPVAFRNIWVRELTLRTLEASR